MLLWPNGPSTSFNWFSKVDNTVLIYILLMYPYVCIRRRIYKSSIIQLNDTWMYLLYVTNTFRDTIHTKQHIIQWLGLLLAPEIRYLCSDCIDWSGHCISSVLEDFALWQKFRQHEKKKKKHEKRFLDLKN